MTMRALALAMLIALGGCSILGDSKSTGPKPAQLQDLPTAAAGRVIWASTIGSSGDYVLTPAVAGDSVYVAAADGSLARLELATGRQQWRIAVGQKISSVGAAKQLVLVGTPRGELLAFGPDGAPLWKQSMTSEVMGSPQVDDNLVVVRSADGRVVGLDAASGKRKWDYQRQLPSLVVRASAGIVAKGGAVFAGFAGGKLLALNAANGQAGWEASVAQPKGATELERIADITSNPVLDRRQICAVAYQGKLACIDPNNGNSQWSRDISSLSGLEMDTKAIYVADDRGAVHALDKQTGASLWKQDKLFLRSLSTPAAQDNTVAVGDFQGVVHFLAKDDGRFVSRVNTDGSAIVAPLVGTDDGVLVQTRNGGIYYLNSK